jgi:glutaminase
MKEAWKNTSQAERSCQKCKREQQKQKEQNELHKIVMKEAQQLMQNMFKQLHQCHHLDNDSDMDKSHQQESMDNITVSECFNLSDLCQHPTKKTETQYFAPISTAILEMRLGKIGYIN